MSLRCNPELSVRKIGDDLFVYDRYKALIHTFNRTGTFLWEAISSGASIDEIVKKTTERFNVSESEASEDVRSFIGKLKELGLLDEAEI